MNKQFVRFSPTNELKELAHKEQSYKALSSVMADIMSVELNANVGVYLYGDNAMDTGNYTLGYYTS